MQIGHGMVFPASKAAQNQNVLETILHGIGQTKACIGVVFLYRVDLYWDCRGKIGYSKTLIGIKISNHQGRYQAFFQSQLSTAIGAKNKILWLQIHQVMDMSMYIRCDNNTAFHNKNIIPSLCHKAMGKYKEKPEPKEDPIK